MVGSSTGKADVERISWRGWLIILTIFATDALSLGSRALFLVMILEWEDDLKWNRASLSALMSIVHICNGLFTPVAGFLIDRKVNQEYVLGGGLAFLSLCFTCTALLSASWQVWFVYGVMSGSAYGLLNLNVFSVAIIRAVPNSRAGLAVGIGTSGSTFGQLALVPAFTYIVQSYGWRTGYASLAITAGLLIIPAVILLRSEDHIHTKQEIVDNHVNNYVAELDCADSSESETETYTTSKSIDNQHAANKLCMLFKLPQYWALTFAFFACGVTTTGFIESHLVALEVLRGEDVGIAAFAFTVLSGVNGLSMVAAGYLADFYDRHRLLGFIFFTRSICYMLLLLPASDHRALLFIFAPIFGFVDYSVVPPVVSVSID